MCQMAVGATGNIEPGRWQGGCEDLSRGETVSPRKPDISQNK